MTKILILWGWGFFFPLSITFFYWNPDWPPKIPWGDLLTFWIPSEVLFAQKDAE